MARVIIMAAVVLKKAAAMASGDGAAVVQASQQLADAEASKQEAVQAANALMGRHRHRQPKPRRAQWSPCF